MAKIKINWSKEAELDLTKILEFYIDGNSKHSKSLYSRIKKGVTTISKNPFIGIKTDIESVRILITGEYLIVYQLFKNEIIISMVWDSRRNPESIELGKRVSTL
jgi:plasmid stabilization system protein ParE